ncbi:DUF421 domain-containing protein [Neobacillus vireti]|uniref:Membrane protein, YKJA-BACSU-like protein n=1 Tax=Neobacillus vireti LMG 21834 TaxID=1131730 RepID=A0AB94IHM7_9BACI|nr:DUF421 domain-containing protein [Neobacillus vireti]ETI66542.1 membrane protein, YKJA-BACSU-like protein [Neobacillus vireti LMG 21834]KLT16532.1 membrane protein [Neobacillus vireti]
MENIFFITIVKGILIYVLALFLTRKIGTKLISKMTFFDFIMGVSMGSIVANAIIDKQFATLSATTALLLFSFLTIFTGYLSMKNLTFRKLINSEPVTLIENGTIVDENMKKMKLTINELKMKLREKDAFNVADVEFAIMEADGNFSVLPKSDKKPLTPSHMNIHTTSTGLEKDIIIDGTIMEENLTDAGLDKEWLTSELNKQNIKDCSEVFYAGLDNTKKLYISKKNNTNKERGGNLS